MPKTLKLFSWNVNGLRAVLRKDALQDFLKTMKPDILCLQEIKAKPEQVDFDFTDYEVFWNPARRPGYSGTAILVAKTLFTSASSESQTIRNHSKTQVSRVVAANNSESQTSCITPAIADLPELSLDEGRILALSLPHFYLVNVYTPNSKPDLSRLELRKQTWDPAFLDLLKSLEKEKPVVTCGDFNAAHTEIDLARPKTNHHSAGFTDAEREGITNLLNAGFIDTFRALHPKSQRYTWWSHWGHARENNVGWRIDYFFISAALRPCLKDALICENVLGSDHCPVGIILEFNS